MRSICLFFLANCCMSQKTEKPVLSGQRIKTRKRGRRCSCCIFLLVWFFIDWLPTFVFVTDEKEKYDPAGFRDFIVVGLNAAGPDVDAIWKFLDSAGSKVDYRRYGEALFDILIAGGLLGKTISWNIRNHFVFYARIRLIPTVALYFGRVDRFVISAYLF